MAVPLLFSNFSSPSASIPPNLIMLTLSTATEKSRQDLIKAAISFKNGFTTEVAPAHRHVLNQFALGRLTIDEVVYYLEATAPVVAPGR
jgi:hypothetical protein